MLRIILATTLLSLTAATMARADPCEGRLPTRHGETFVGTVRYVGDGDSLCVGRTSDPNDWIEVRLADFDAPQSARRPLISSPAALGKTGTAKASTPSSATNC